MARVSNPSRTPHDDLEFGGFDLTDLVGSANFNVTDADVTDDNDGETAPGNPLDPEDFAKAMSESYDAPLLDEVITYVFHYSVH